MAIGRARCTKTFTRSTQRLEGTTTRQLISHIVSSERTKSHTCWKIRTRLNSPSGSTTSSTTWARAITKRGALNSLSSAPLENSVLAKLSVWSVTHTRDHLPKPTYRPRRTICGRHRPLQLFITLAAVLARQCQRKARVNHVGPIRVRRKTTELSRNVVHRSTIFPYRLLLRTLRAASSGQHSTHSGSLNRSPTVPPQIASRSITVPFR